VSAQIGGGEVALQPIGRVSDETGVQGLGPLIGQALAVAGPALALVLDGLLAEAKAGGVAEEHVHAYREINGLPVAQDVRSVAAELVSGPPCW
jgi:hypothetical protein